MVITEVTKETPHDDCLDVHPHLVSGDINHGFVWGYSSYLGATNHDEPSCTSQYPSNLIQTQNVLPAVELHKVPQPSRAALKLRPCTTPQGKRPGVQGGPPGTL